MSKRVFFLVIFLIFLCSLFLRVYSLSLRPLHHDEGVSWYFFVKKISQGEPVDFYFEQHGLLPFFLAAIPFRIFGDSIFSLRLAPALFGAFSSFLFFFLANEFGYFSCLIASLLLALSPTMTYYSRFLISYPYFIFFFLVFLIGLLKYLKTSQKIYLSLSLFALTCLCLINEAVLIYLLSFLISFLITLPFSQKTRNSFKQILKKTKLSFVFLNLLFCLFFFVLIQTCFFQNWLNLFKLELLPKRLLSKSFQTGHNKPFFYYLKTIISVNFPLLLLFFLALIISLKNFFQKRKEILPFFFLFFSLINFLFFSLIKYKTPWVLTLIIFPLIIFVGLSLGNFLSQKHSRLVKIILSLFLSFSFLWTFLSCLDKNFFTYAEETSQNPLSYVQTKKEVNDLTKEIDSYAQKNNSKLKILIIAKSYWPLPFYLRNYSLFYLNKPEELTYSLVKDYNVVIADKDQKISFSLDSFKVKEWTLRPGVNLLVLFK